MRSVTCLECRESSTGRCRRHQSMLMTGEDPEPDVFGGQFYERGPDGKLQSVGTTAPRAPDVWICRRVSDYYGSRVPAGGAVAPCTKCGESVVFNPRREVDAPKICMQCGGIQPLPIGS
jgi:hypothetical protein